MTFCVWDTGLGSHRLLIMSSTLLSPSAYTVIKTPSTSTSTASDCVDSLLESLTPNETQSASDVSNSNSAVIVPVASS